MKLGAQQAGALRAQQAPLQAIGVLWGERGLAYSLCKALCWGVTQRGAGQKLVFGRGTKLTINPSEYGRMKPHGAPNSFVLSRPHPAGPPGQALLALPGPL